MMVPAGWSPKAHGQICGSVIPPQVTEPCVLANAALVASRGWLFQGPSLKGNSHEPRCTELLLWRRGRSLQFCRIGRLHRLDRARLERGNCPPVQKPGLASRHSRPTRSLDSLSDRKRTLGSSCARRFARSALTGLANRRLCPTTSLHSLLEILETRLRRYQAPLLVRFLGDGSRAAYSGLA